MNGTVKFFNEGKGFGFISAEDGKEYFVHVTGLDGISTLKENDNVEFEVTEGDRGPKAVGVKLSGSAGNTESSAPAEEEPAEPVEETEDFGEEEAEDSEEQN